MHVQLNTVHAQRSLRLLSHPFLTSRENFSPRSLRVTSPAVSIVNRYCVWGRLGSHILVWLSPHPRRSSFVGLFRRSLAGPAAGARIPPAPGRSRRRACRRGAPWRAAGGPKLPRVAATPPRRAGGRGGGGGRSVCASSGGASRTHPPTPARGGED